MRPEFFESMTPILPDHSRNSYAKALISVIAGLGVLFFFVNRVSHGASIFLLAMLAIFYAVKNKEIPFSRRDGGLMLISAALPLAYLCGMLISGFDYGLLDKVLRLLLIAPIFWVVRCHGISASTFLICVSSGVIFSGIDSLDKILHGATRVSGMSVPSPIPFGNFSLLFAVLGFVFLFCRRELRAPKWFNYICLAGLLAGIFSSFASGTRGGWVAMPMFALIFWKFFGPHDKRASFAVCALGVLMIVCGAYLVPGISTRVVEGATDVQKYFSRSGGWLPGDAIGSLDTRLDMWVAGVEAFRSAPLLGLGFPGFNEFLHHRIELGLSHPDLESVGYKHLHCEIITTAAKLGLMGLLALAILWIGGIRWFLSEARTTNPTGTCFRVMGLITLTAMITFSMTDSMFGMTLHSMVYTLFLGISAGGLRHAELNTESRSALQ